MTGERSYDVIVFGATGFTGRLVAEYLARWNREERFRWAIAGRSAGRLASVKAAVDNLELSTAEVGVIEASLDDPASLDRMAAQARVVLTTVGPYAKYGEPVVEACVRQGTDYVDITGEPAFVNSVIERHDAAARDRGVRIVNCCGFESIPIDLGALFTVRQLPQGEPITVEGFVRSRGSFSGGTWQSAIGAMANLRRAKSKAPREATGGKRVHGQKPRLRHERSLGAWVAPMPTIDPEIVLRSARALDAYGPDFRYGHYVQIRSGAALARAAVGLGAVVALAQFPPTRELLLKLRGSGEGPSAEERAKNWFQVTFHGQSTSRRVVTRVSGGDPGYGETAKIVSEAALCLALDRDRLPDRAGVLTPVVAMGDLLEARLERAGIHFEVLERG